MSVLSLKRRALDVCVAFVLSVAVAGCHSAGSGSPQVVPFAKAPGLQSRIQNLGRPIGKIKHIVIIVQMDRSFNNLFYGFPGAKTATYGYDSKNRKVALRPVSLATTWDLQHNANGFIVSCNGTGKIPRTNCRMNGFNREVWSCDRPGQPKCPIKYPPYAYVPHDQIKPYFDMAKQYVLADEMYASNFDGGSFESLQYIIEAQDHDTIGGSSRVLGCGGGPKDWIKTIGGGRINPCFGNPTLGDELDAAGLHWAYYAVSGKDRLCGRGGSGESLWSAYAAIKQICFGADWGEDVISPPKRFISDVKNGGLRAVTWITPTCADSDEAGCNSDAGPSWVASLVNAVGESKFWDSTAIFIFWDSYGGWYDPEPPQYLDEDGLGFRVPLLVISPFAKDGYVSHVHYEHGSILKFIEDRFGLARLATSDKRANSPETDSFDFTQPPRKFMRIGSK